jgi:hypothetical protein
MKRYLLYEIALLLLLTVPAIAQESPDSSSSDSALVLLPWERFAETYFLNLSPTKPILRFYPETHMLTYEFYKDNVFLDFHKIESMSDSCSSKQKRRFNRRVRDMVRAWYLTSTSPR